MATTIVSARIDESVKERAGAFIQAAGLTTGDVIKAVWERIAKTGEVPMPDQVTQDEESAAWEDFMSFRQRLGRELAVADGPGELAGLDDQKARQLVADMLEDKYA